MKHFVKMMSIALFAMVIISCSDNIADEQQTPIPPTPPAIGKESVHAEIVCPDLASDLECMDSYWIKNCTIEVFSELSRSRYTFAGATGDYVGDFVKSKDFDKIDCTYQGAYAMYNCKSCGASNGSLVLQYTVSEVQPYTKNTFNSQHNVLYGTSEDGESFEFSSLLGVLQVGLTGFEAVKKVTLIGNNNEYIAGDYYIDVTAPDKVTCKHKAYLTIISCAEDGEQLSPDEVTYFNFLLLPTTFSKGFTINVTFVDGSTYEIVHSAKCSVRRNHVSKVATYSALAPDVQLLCLFHMGSSVLLPIFSSGSGTVGGSAYMGDGNSVSLDGVTRYDYDGKAERALMFKVKGATNIYFESLEGISKIDFSNF